MFVPVFLSFWRQNMRLNNSQFFWQCRNSDIGVVSFCKRCIEVQINLHNAFISSYEVRFTSFQNFIEPSVRHYKHTSVLLNCLNECELKVFNKCGSQVNIVRRMLAIIYIKFLFRLFKIFFLNYLGSDFIRRFDIL